MTRPEAAEIMARYSRLEVHGRRAREMARALGASGFAWEEHRYAVLPEEVEACPATRRVFGAVRKRTHQLNAGGWPLLERMLAPRGATFAELGAVLGAPPASARSDLATFLGDLARAGLLHVSRDAQV